MIAKSKMKLDYVCARDVDGLRKLIKKHKAKSHDDIKTLPGTSDVYLVCVSDDAIKQVVDSLPKQIRKHKIIAHTSGNANINKVLIKAKNRGVLYPVQTFSKGMKMKYSDIPFCINGNSKLVITCLTAIGASISTLTYLIDENQRRHIHLAAVLTNNFVNHILNSAQVILERENIDSEILLPLLKETVRKMTIVGSHKAQTGPARRKDNETINDHLKLLNKSDAKLYQLISDRIFNKYNLK